MVNITKKDAELTLIEMMSEKGITLKANEISDFGLIGGETNSQIQEYVNDYVSDIHTEMCESKNSWRYEH